MFGIHSFLLFMASGLLLNITPGADMLYTINSSARSGVRAGIAAACGIFSGTLFHIAFAVVGLSALLATSAVAFAVVKYLGAAYLVYLGIRMLVSHDNNAMTERTQGGGHSLRNVYKQGVLINLFNPKIALFFLAFLPQFIDTGNTQRVVAFLLLGLTFNLTGICVNSLVAWSADSVRQRMDGTGRVGRWLKMTAGGLFVGLGLMLALDSRN